MSVSGVNNSSTSLPTGPTNGQPSYADVTRQFMDYMKETPAQRMEDAWLAAHGLTRQQFDAMSGPQKEALIKEMQQDIERQLRQQAENAAKSKDKGQVQLPGMMVAL